MIRKMEQSDVDECLKLEYHYFGHFWGDVNDEETRRVHDEYQLQNLDLNVSLVAEKDSKIIGVYFLKECKLPIYPGNFYDFTGDNSKGLEGVALFVHPDYKSTGIGHRLKYYYKENNKGYSFIWGEAFHGLNNMKHWLKSRILFNDLSGIFYTIEFYSPANINKYPKTKYLDFYEKNNESAVDIIIKLLKQNKNTIDIIEIFKNKYNFNINIEEVSKLIKRLQRS